MIPKQGESAFRACHGWDYERIMFVNTVKNGIQQPSFFVSVPSDEICPKIFTTGYTTFFTGFVLNITFGIVDFDIITRTITVQRYFFSGRYGEGHSSARFEFFIAGPIFAFVFVANFITVSRFAHDS